MCACLAFLLDFVGYLFEYFLVHLHLVHVTTIALNIDYWNEHDPVPEGGCQPHGLFTGVWVQCEREHGARPFLLRLQRDL